MAPLDLDWESVSWNQVRDWILIDEVRDLDFSLGDLEQVRDLDLIDEVRDLDFGLLQILMIVSTIYTDR
jgi:hypothetical protein